MGWSHIAPSTNVRAAKGFRCAKKNDPDLTGKIPHCSTAELLHIGPEASMKAPKDFLRFSKECLRIADEVRSTDERERLLQMAQAWSRLAAGEQLDEECD